MTLHDVAVILGLGVVGGIFGTAFNEAWTRIRRPRGRRHRGEHRPAWRRARRIDPYASTDVPLTELDTEVGAPTEEIPKPGGGAAHEGGHP